MNGILVKSEMVITENTMFFQLGEWGVIPSRSSYLRFDLLGAVLTKSRCELQGHPTVIVKAGRHYELRKVVWYKHSGRQQRARIRQQRKHYSATSAEWT